MTDRLVRHLASGELRIETRGWRLFQQRMTAHKADPTRPEPFPDGHCIFDHPEQYGCVAVTEHGEQLGLMGVFDR